MSDKFDFTFGFQFGRPSGFQPVEGKIKSVAQLMSCINYMFDNWQTANLKLDSNSLPAMLNVLPVSGNFNLSKQQIKDYPNLLIAFMDKVDLDFDGGEADNTIERCKAYAQEFILLVNKSGLFEPISGNIPYSVFYDKLDVNVAGITLELTLKEIHGLVLCPNKTVEEIVYGDASKQCGCTGDTQ